MSLPVAMRAIDLLGQAVIPARKAVRARVQDTTNMPTTRLTPQAAALLQKLQGPPPRRLLSVERSLGTLEASG